MAKLTDYIKTNQSFSGCDMVASIDFILPSGKRISRVLGQVQTINYSTFMDKKPVRSLGNVNAKDYTYGPRTIAGSLIFTVFNRHWLHELIESSGDEDAINYEYLVDELPPFNITITAMNEYGYQSRMALYGVRLLSEGEVLSINDVYTENTYQFVATGLDYLKGSGSVIAGGSEDSIITTTHGSSSVTKTNGYLTNIKISTAIGSTSTPVAEPTVTIAGNKIKIMS